MAQTPNRNLVLHISSPEAKREAMRLYRELYKKEALMDRNRLMFSSNKLFADLTANEKFLLCPLCKNHFLRGVLVAYSSLTDPEKAYRLEIRLRDPDQLQILTDIFEQIDCETSEEGESLVPHIRTTAEGCCLYFRKSGAIESLLAFAGADRSVFAYMNAKIKKGIRNDENRATNCVARNIDSAVKASAEICRLISYLKEIGKLEILPSELLQTALLRAEHPEASMAELARMHNPTITKSGLSHRLRKITEIAKKEQENREKRKI